ncbi:Uncharacterized protein Rs2_04399 [Raphanus sativus]|nr:Uncharacterized protein Rs2_04399 [Raphanus sativus]
MCHKKILRVRKKVKSIGRNTHLHEQITNPTKAMLTLECVHHLRYFLFPSIKTSLVSLIFSPNSHPHFKLISHTLSLYFHNQQVIMYLVAHLVTKSFDGDSAVYVEDVVDTSRAANIENGGDDDDGGYDYAPAA